MDEPNEEITWPTHCRECGTELAHATLDFDTSNEDRNQLNPGEMVAIDYCPNPDCSANPAQD